MSATRLKNTTSTENVNVMAMITGVSLLRIESMSR
jgi:hypothetical protein